METNKVVGGKLEVTETPDVIIRKYSVDDVIGKIAEIQTKIDHLTIDLNEQEALKTRWNNYLTSLR